LGGGRNLYLITDEATGLHPIEGRFLLATAGGRSYDVDVAVLALGNFPPDRVKRPGTMAPASKCSPRSRARPPCAADRHRHTMVDVCLALLEERF
jgi:hypothetical protein